VNNGISLSRVFALMSSATRTSRTVPARTASRTRSVPESTAPARAARPSRRSTGSVAPILRVVGLRGRRGIRARTLRQRQAEDVRSELTGLGQLLLRRPAIRRRCILARVLDRQRFDQPEHVVRVLCRDAGDTEQIVALQVDEDRKSTRLNSSHVKISYAVFCLKKKKK